MKFLITILLLSISLLSFGQEEPEFGSVNVSIEKYKNRPVAIFSNHGEQYFLTIRTNKINADYMLKLFGADSNMGITESTYDLCDQKGKKLGLKVRHVIGNVFKKPIHTLTILSKGDNPEEKEIELHLVAL